MNDIVERLRRYKRDRSGYAEYCHQAADEIERLRNLLAADVHSCHPGCTRSGCVNGRLLEAIQHYEAALKLSWPEGAAGGAFDCWNYARIALYGDRHDRQSGV